MSEPVTQAQDHDRRIGRLEGIAEQLTEQLREQNRQTNARFDAVERAIAEQGRRLDVLMDTLRQEHRRDFRWLIGIQLTTLIALGTLILSRLD
ncbi:MAG: hypothetical protein F4Z85_12200 [Gemmatimonadetes bacterium]|nr:hypothetical protein [Gemmatimonadota bacterium]MYB68042.1 hypothetical protein [Gemmatimonadota bacterium]